MPTLVLVPGLLCTPVLFEAQTQALATQIKTAVAQTTGMDSITAMAEHLLRVHQGELIVAGLSMGGYIAMEAARLAPERVSALGLLSTAADQDSQERQAMRRELIRISALGKFKGVTPRLLPQFLSPAALQDDELRARVIAMAGTVGQKNFVLQQSAIMGRRDQRAFLATYKRPSLVLCGTQDTLTPPEKSHEMAALLPDSELVLLESTGHLSTMEAPHDCTQALMRLIARA